jgi:hypothetical protein
LTRTQRDIEEYRQGNACLAIQDAAGRPCPGLQVEVEQETHAFPFACAVPDLAAFSEDYRQRYRARLDEVFNAKDVANAPPGEPEMIQVDVPDGVALGTLRLQLDRLAATGPLLAVHVGGRTAASPLLSASASEQEATQRVAELYTLCFAHPAVGRIVWHGFVDGETGVGTEGLLRPDLSPRPAFHVLRELLGMVWHTRAAGATDGAGQFTFRGFFGDYRLVVHGGEQPATVVPFSLRRTAGPTMPFLVEVPAAEP